MAHAPTPWTRTRRGFLKTTSLTALAAACGRGADEPTVGSMGAVKA